MNAKFAFPRGITMGGAGDVLYLADTGNNCIRSVMLPSGHTQTFAGSSVKGLKDGVRSSRRSRRFCRFCRVSGAALRVQLVATRLGVWTRPPSLYHPPGGSRACLSTPSETTRSLLQSSPKATLGP